MTHDFIEAGEIKHPVEIHYENRRTSRVSIGKKAVYIRLPHNIPKSVAEKHIRHFKSWALDKLMQKGVPGRQIKKRLHASGDTIVVAGRDYTLVINAGKGKSNSARIVRSEVRIALAPGLRKEKRPEVISTLLSRCFARLELPALKSRVALINEKLFRFEYNRVCFKYTKTRWGSCSSKGNINISTRLLLAPQAVLDYVIVHELAHLKHRNHSQSFWQLVTRVMPSWKEKKKWLREHHETCWF